MTPTRELYIFVMLLLCRVRMLLLTPDVPDSDNATKAPLTLDMRVCDPDAISYRVEYCYHVSQLAAEIVEDIICFVSFCWIRILHSAGSLRHFCLSSVSIPVLSMTTVFFQPRLSRSQNVHTPEK